MAGYLICIEVVTFNLGQPKLWQSSGGKWMDSDFNYSPTRLIFRRSEHRCLPAKRNQELPTSKRPALICNGELIITGCFIFRTDNYLWQLVIPFNLGQPELWQSSGGKWMDCNCFNPDFNYSPTRLIFRRSKHTVSLPAKQYPECRSAKDLPCIISILLWTNSALHIQDRQLPWGPNDTIQPWTHVLRPNAFYCCRLAKDLPWVICILLWTNSPYTSYSGQTIDRWQTRDSVWLPTRHALTIIRWQVDGL